MKSSTAFADYHTRCADDAKFTTRADESRQKTKNAERLITWRLVGHHQANLLAVLCSRLHVRTLQALSTILFLPKKLNLACDFAKQ
jgi:hypothetical protein